MSLFSRIRQHLPFQSTETNTEVSQTGYIVEPMSFRSHGETLGADFYRPQGVKQPAVIIMAHGFAGERKFSLPQTATRFAEAGYAVVLFDYRGFGNSSGQPRELVSVQHHLEDWQAVLDQVRRRKDVDTRRIVLWGTSFSGGHVITIAARNRSSRSGVAGVISLVPGIDGLAASTTYPKLLLPKAMALGLRDLAASRVGAEPVRVPVVARDGVRCLASPDSYDGYMSMVPAGTNWTGHVPARIIALAGLYRPTALANKVTVPTLMIGAEKDAIIPIKATRKAAAKLRRGHYVEWPMGHFELYQGQEWFERGIAEQLAFLRRIL